MDSFAHTVRIPFCAEEIYLLGEAADLRGEGEELLGDFFAEAAEFGVVAVFGVVGAAVGGWLREGGR